MFNFEYMNLRHIADQNNASIGSDHPCRRGCSACCTREVPVATTDAKHIQAAVSRGAIPLETVEMAKRNASGHGRSCPFLADGNCTIYEFRPLICAITGAGGVATSKRQIEQLNSGEVEGLPVKNLSSSMCREGHAILARNNVMFTRQSITDTQEVLVHLARHKFGSTKRLAEWLTPAK